MESWVALAQARLKTATRGSGEICREGSELDQPRGSQTQQVNARRTHIRAELSDKEPKQQLADVPERCREGNELRQPNSIRARQVSANVLHIRAQTHGQKPK
jgi:hypothetical protein